MTIWIEDYINLLLAGFNQQADELKQKYIPSSLYKYRFLNTYTLNCLQRSAIWMSPANKLNDPFESALFFNDREIVKSFFKQKDFAEQFRFHYGCDITKAEIDLILSSDDSETKFQAICKEKNIKRDFSNTVIFRDKIQQDYIDKHRAYIRICSLSERNDSLLMWSHYADSHRGISIEYDFSNNKELSTYLEPAYYTDKIFNMTPYLSTKKVSTKVVSITKALDWQYEKEWRITFPSTNTNPKDGYFKVPTPKAIYLGARFHENSEEMKLCLFSICERMEISICQMDIHRTEFKITPI